MVLPRNINTEEHTYVIVNPNKNHNVKYCARCREDRPTSEFYRNKNKYDGYSSYCKEHSRAATKDSQQKAKERKNDNS